MTAQQSIWVHVEQTDGRIADVSLELVGKARDLADRLGYAVVGLLCGHGVEDLAWDVIRHGADRILLADHPELALYRTLPYARVAIAEARKRQPEIFLVGGTPNGRDFAPRVASALRCGLTADCTDLQIGDYTSRTGQNVRQTCCTRSGRRSAATWLPRSSIRIPDRRWPPSARASCTCRSPIRSGRAAGGAVTPAFEPGRPALEVAEPPAAPSPACI